MKEPEFHGLSDTPEYAIWNTMIQRCLNPNTESYQRYGERGITVCNRWLQSFKAFYDDMGTRPSSQHSIERINNDGNYEPSNCKWDIKKNQARNRSTNHHLDYHGERSTIAEWSEKKGIGWMTIKRRLENGHTAEEALDKELGAHTSRLYTMDGKCQSLRMWADEIGVSYSTLYYRIVTCHWPLDKALSKTD
jgi:hypothetical protein